ncbi:MAG: cache domain-containing protein, partial [Lachnospiraceae bacterium]|nr:cache domain-containing protein [Lachnospiraceae bacterium]
MSAKMEESTLEELMCAAQGMECCYGYDLANEESLVDGFVEYNPEEYIDKVYNKTGIHLTMFKDNIRFMTSLRNADGTRNEGTESSPEVWAAVSAGNVNDVSTRMGDMSASADELKGAISFFRN